MTLFVPTIYTRENVSLWVGWFITSHLGQNNSVFSFPFPMQVVLKMEHLNHISNCPQDGKQQNSNRVSSLFWETSRDISGTIQPNRAGFRIFGWNYVSGPRIINPVLRLGQLDCPKHQHQLSTRILQLAKNASEKVLGVLRPWSLGHLCLSYHYNPSRTMLYPSEGSHLGYPHVSHDWIWPSQLTEVQWVRKCLGHIW